MSSLSNVSSAVLEPRFAPGQVIGGKYRIEGCLGSGGMGVVLSARHLDLDLPVAIKLVRAEFLANQEIVARALMEARAVAQLRSRHVVRVLDVARLDSGAPYIVMERLDGCDLADLMDRRGALTLREAVDYVLQACEGLREAHALGIVHRDLKPENLFLADTPEGAVLKILDFGIAKGLRGARQPRSLTRAGMVVGSPFYMSPEQMRASPDVDDRSDIWSLGAILHELVSGACAFEADTARGVCVKVLNENPAPLAIGGPCGSRLAAIVQRCLQKSPAQRYASISELSAELRSLADELEALGCARDNRIASGVALKRESVDTAVQMAAVRGTRGSRSLFGALALLTSLGLAGALLGRDSKAGVVIESAEILPAMPPRAESRRQQAVPELAAAPLSPARSVASPTVVEDASSPLARRPSAPETPARAAINRPKEPQPPRVNAPTAPQSAPATSSPARPVPVSAWGNERFGGRY